MKIIHFIPPVVAVLASAIWINHQENTLTELEEQTSLLRGRLVLARQAFASASTENSNAGENSGSEESSNEFALPDGTPDWKAIAEAMNDVSPNGMPRNFKAMFVIQKKLAELEPDELLAGIRATRALEMNEQPRSVMENEVMRMLGKKNPKLALEAVEGSIGDRENPGYWAVQSAFEKLVGSDPIAAQAWLDSKIQSGKLDSKALDRSQSSRLSFEAKLISGLLQETPEIARTRLTNFTAVEKEKIFESGHQWRVNGKVPPAYADLVRENFNPDRSVTLIGKTYGSIHNKEGLGEVEGVLDNPEFSDDEKTEIASRAVVNLIRHSNTSDVSIAESYQLAQKNAPEQANQLIVRGLEGLYRRSQNLEATVEEALSLNEPAIAGSLVASLQADGHFKNEVEADKFKNPETKAKLDKILSSIPSSDSPE